MNDLSLKMLFMMAVAAALLSSCMPARYAIPVPADDRGGLELQRNADRYPSEFSASQRIVLTVKSKEYDFVGFLARRGGETRALAFGDMGGKIFDFQLSGEGSRILLKPDGMPERPLSEGVLGDIAHLFGTAAAPARADVNERPDGGLSVIVPGAETSSSTEYVFSKHDGNCEATFELQQGKIVRSVEFTDYTVFPGWEKPVPRVTWVRNYRWHYTLRIELLTLNAGSADGREAEDALQENPSQPPFVKMEGYL